jgi:biotin transport system substrate-specific component
MQKRIVKKVKNSKFIKRFPPLSIGSLVVVLICAFLIITSTFTPIPQLMLTIPKEALINPSVFFAQIHSIEKVSSIFYYIPQIPVILMIAAILGPRLGMISVVIYIACGLAGFPVFAGGGGLNYYLQHSFGYILGFIPGVFTCGNILTGKQPPFSAFRAAIVGTLAVHIFGILYLTTVLTIKRESIFTIFGWIWQLSGMQFFNDILWGIAAVLLGRLLRKALWVAMD